MVIVIEHFVFGRFTDCEVVFLFSRIPTVVLFSRENERRGTATEEIAMRRKPSGKENGQPSGKPSIGKKENILSSRLLTSNIEVARGSSCGFEYILQKAVPKTGPWRFLCRS